MADSETLVFRASLTPKIFRAFEIADTRSLYVLAQAVIGSFEFDFDHAFGFYSKLKWNIYDSPVLFELFGDMGGGAGRNARSAKPPPAVGTLPSRGPTIR